MAKYYRTQFEKANFGDNLQSIVKPVNQQQVAPSVNLTPSFQSQPLQPTPKLPQDKSFIQRAFDALVIPSQKTEQFLTGGQSYEKRLSQAGLQSVPGKLDLNDVISTAGKFILDPLNFIPVGKVAKLVSKIPGVTKTFSALGRGAELVSQIPLPKLSMEKNVLKLGSTNVKNIAENLGQKFVRGYKLPEGYNIAKSEIPTKVGMGAAEIIDRTKGQFAGMSNDLIEAIPKFLEPKVAGAGVDLGALRKTLGADFDKIRPVLTQVKQQFNEDIYDLVQRGRMQGETAKRLLTQGGYYPHTDFAPERIKKYFDIKPKIGERRGYLKQRKGAEGFTFNAPKAIARREMGQFQDNVIQDFLIGVKKQFGVQLGKGNAVPEGFTPFLDSVPGRLRELKGWALPERIAKDLNDSISTGGAIGRAVDTFNALWKPTATSMNPGFHFMNVLGNLYNTWLGGMKDPKRFLQAIKGGFSKDEGAILKRVGILDRGQFGGDIVTRTFDNPEGIDTIKLFSKFRRLGEYFENNARSAFFLDQRAKLLKQGLSDIQANRKAVEKVNEYLFDYLTGLAPFETNVMRRIFPFYTWARFNIPLQFKNVITQPHKAAFVSKVNQALNKGGNPEGSQEGFDIPTPFVDSQGNQVRYRPNLPIQDIFNLNPQRLGSMVNPLFKLGGTGLLTLASGGKIPPYDSFTGRPMTNPALPVSEQLKDITKNVVTSTLRPVRSFQKISEEDYTPLGIARQLLGGTYTINPESIQLQKVSQRDRLNNAIEEKARQIQRNMSLTMEEKRQRINELFKYRQ